MRQAALWEEEKISSLRPLRPRQEQAIEAIRQAVREGHKRIIVQAPTGFGKTLTAAHLIQNSIDKGKRPLFTCPAITLVNQTLKSFESEGISDIGVIQAQHERTDWLAQVQIASVQTLIRRALPEVDFVIVDEAHSQWEKFNDLLDSETWKNKIVIGLTATPWSKGMGLRWTKLIIAATIQQLIDEGYLSPFIGYGPGKEFEPDIAGIKIRNGEFDEAGSAAAMDKPKLVGNVVDTWMMHRQEGRHPGDRTFLYGVNRKHAQSLQEAFLAAGIKFGYIDGNSDPDERKDTFERYRSGEYKGIASVGCLITGVDEDVRVIVDAALTRSEITHVQKNGRGLRPRPDKPYLLILDHAGNNERLGSVTEIFHDTLDMRKPNEKGDAYKGDKPAIKPRKCPKCNALIPVGKRACLCGQILPAISDVIHEDGELALFGSGKKSKKQDPTPIQKEEFYAQLIWIADDKGRKRGWADHAFREKFGHFPAKKYGIQPTLPSMTVVNYVRSRNIAKAKAREKAAKI